VLNVARLPSSDCPLGRLGSGGQVEIIFRNNEPACRPAGSIIINNIGMKDLEKKKDFELVKMLKEKREQLRAFRFGVTGSKTKNVKEGKNTRRDVARILTEVSKRSQKTNV